jgi:general secretion pathway protein A
MYETFFGLTERPFSLLPDPDFLYLSPQHKLARAYLEYGLTQKLGFVVLTGEIGTGKTTLIKSLLKARADKHRLGVLYQTSFGAEDLLELLLKEFEIKGQFHSRATRLSAFNEFLIKAYSKGEHVVLIVDEAHNLGAAALEELRLLSNLQADKEPLLQVILVGQPNLRDRLRQPFLRQLAQRVGVHFHLQPLDEEETKEYIRYRLARAGGSGIFTPSALDKIYACTRGVPRRINSWCDLALVAAFAEGRQEIDREFLATVVAAQGGSLEGPDQIESGPEQEIAQAPELLEAGDPDQSSSELIEAGSREFANIQLRREILELSERMARLEGLVLELVGQLVPAITKFFAYLPSESSKPASPPQPSLGWNPGIQQQAAGIMESVSRFCGQFWKRSKGAAGRVTDGILNWGESEDPGQIKRMIIGVTGALLVLILLIWGGWVMFRKTEKHPAPLPSLSTPSAPEAPKASEAKPPQAAVPPLKAGSTPAHTPPSAHAAVKPAPAPATPKETKATPISKEHYQLYVAAYRDYGDALFVKKKIQANNIPVKVYRETADKKVYFAVKAGPFTSKEQAESVASSLKSSLHLNQTPKVVKVKNEA